MIVYDDLEPSEKVKVYDKGITLNTDQVVRARWISVEDTRSLFRRCVEGDNQRISRDALRFGAKDSAV